MESYYIGCYWQDRKENTDECTGRIVNCLTGLSKCDEIFAEVYAVPPRKLPYRISVDTETIRPIVESGRNREDFSPYKVIEKLGYSGSFVSDFRKQNEKWVLRFVCGAYANTPGFLNRCVLSLPKQGPARETLLQLDTMICSITTLVEAWDPDWAVVQSTEFRRLISDDASIPGKALGGWLVYFASHLRNVPADLEAHSRMELEKGTLLVLLPDAITSQRPDHVATVQTAVSRLQHAGLIPAEGTFRF